jgi:hypothetical protein
MMTGCVFGKDESALKNKLPIYAMYGRTIEEFQQQGVIAGSLDAIKEQLQTLEQAGLQRIMLQWLDLDDLESLEVLANGIL